MRASCLTLCLAFLLSACGSKSLNHAPVEDRGVHAQGTSAGDTKPVPAVKPPPGFENAGKPGYYTVKPGDTLIRIGLDAGQSHKDIARWNALENPNRIEVGQVIRVVPPLPAEGYAVAVAKPITSSSVVGTPIVPAGAVPSVPAKAASAASAAASAPAVVAPAGPAAATSSASGDDEITWIWPHGGQVLSGFDESKNSKGVDIAGASGEAVVAAAEGKVVYAGAGLRGYGNLIILKHNSTYLSAYAHNKVILVKEDQTVKRGQKIAEMGDTDSDRVKLHFEVRRQGKPVDPTRYLPTR